jgi:hypothetical protein
MVMLRLLLLLLRLLLLLLLLLPLLLLLLLLLVASFGVKSKLTPSFFSNPLPPSPPQKKTNPLFGPTPLTHTLLLLSHTLLHLSHNACCLLPRGPPF